LQVAVVKAKGRYGVSEFSKIVSVGDGLWDVRTAHNLNFAFLGIGRGAAKEELYRAGVTHVLEDLADYCEVMRQLEAADIPRL
jgi:phosphoglycolate phosphatase-like HAD superfamily hydrolase